MHTLSRSAFAYLLVAVFVALYPSATLGQTPGYILMLAPPAPASITAPAGGTALLSIFIIPLNGFTGKIDFTCTISGGSAPLPTCSTPPSVNVTGTGALSSVATVTTNNLTPTGRYTVTVTGADAKRTAAANGPQSMPLDVSHSYSVGSDGGGSVALATLAGLLVVWAILRRRQAMRPAL